MPIAECPDLAVSDYCHWRLCDNGVVIIRCIDEAPNENKECLHMGRVIKSNLRFPLLSRFSIVEARFRLKVAMAIENRF
jgi:hypothetical protein